MESMNMSGFEVYNPIEALHLRARCSTALVFEALAMAYMDRHQAAAAGFSRKDLCVRPSQPIAPETLTDVTRVTRQGPQPLKGMTQASRDSMQGEAGQQAKSAFDAECDLLEQRLKQAVWARTTSFSGEATTLRKAFQFFDRDNNGTVDLDEFTHTLEHLGLHSSAAGLPGQGGVSRETVASLFQRYDADGGGTISYDEFCERFLKEQEQDMYTARML